MNRLNRLFGRVDPRTLRREMRGVHDALSALAKKIDATRLQAEQVAALRLDATHAAARIDGLDDVLDRNRVAGHVRDATRRAERIDAPVPHAVVAGVLPRGAYEAAVDAIPSRIFFDSRAGRHELTIPPTLAPAHVIVVWSFLAEIMKNALAPAVVELFQEPLDRHVRSLLQPAARSGDEHVVLAASQARLVRRAPGGAAAPVDRGKWDWLTVVLCLGGADERDVDLDPRLNTALTVFDPAGTYEYLVTPELAVPGVERYSCEFRLGPDKKSRRLLADRMHEPQ